MKNKTSIRSANNKKSNEDSNFNAIYIDSKNSHADDHNIFSIHPNKLHFLGNFEKESFDAGVIQNCPSSTIKTLGLFYLVKILKPNAKLDVIIDQPISVMQGLDASEIEANAKLAGFVDIQQSDYETTNTEGERKMNIKTISLTMTRPEKLKKNIEVEVEEKIVIVKEREIVKTNKRESSSKSPSPSRKK